MWSDTLITRTSETVGELSDTVAILEPVVQITSFSENSTCTNLRDLVDS